MNIELFTCDQISWCSWKVYQHIHNNIIWSIIIMQKKDLNGTWNDLSSVCIFFFKVNQCIISLVYIINKNNHKADYETQFKKWFALCQSKINSRADFSSKNEISGLTFWSIFSDKCGNSSFLKSLGKQSQHVHCKLMSGVWYPFYT